MSAVARGVAVGPTVSVVLLVILRVEQVTARHRVRTEPWVRRAKWFTLAATCCMNTWASYAAGSLAGIALRSVPSLVVMRIRGGLMAVRRS